MTVTVFKCLFQNGLGTSLSKFLLPVDLHWLAKVKHFIKRIKVLLKRKKNMAVINCLSFFSPSLVS